MSAPAPPAAVASPPPPAGRWQPWAAVIAALAIALALYGPVVGADFAFDDPAAVTTNPLVTGEAPWTGAFTENFWGGRPGFEHLASWRPLTVLSLRLDHALGGGAPNAFHLVNLLLHLGVLLLLVLAALRAGAGSPLAFALGALVAAHPALSEAVASVVGRGDLLAALLGLGGLVALRRRPALAVALLCAALLAKESAVAAALAALLVALGQRRWRVAGAVAVVIVAWYGVRAAAVGHLGGAVPLMDNPLGALAGVERLPAALAVVGRYASWSLAPQAIAADYSFGAALDGPGSPYAWLGALAALLLLGALVAALRARRWTAVWGVATTAASWALLSNLLFTLPAPLAGRLAYLPVCGLLVAAVAVAGAWPERQRRIAALALVAWALAAVPATLGQVAAWRGDPSLFEHSVAEAPSVRARVNLASALLKAGEPVAAEVQLRAALARAPAHPTAWLNLALAVDAQDRPAEAWTLAQRAAGLERTGGKARANLCALAVARRAVDDDAAVLLCQRAVAATPRLAEPLVNLARALARRGDRADAEAAFGEALSLAPRSAFARGHWVSFLVEGGRLAEAVAAQRALYDEAPRDRERHRNLVALLLQLAVQQARAGDQGAACHAATQAAELAPVEPVVAQRRTYCGH